MPSKKRRNWTAEQKLEIIEEARRTEMSVSEVCRRHGISAGQFYAWEKKARTGAKEALQARKRGRRGQGREAILETELTRMREVVAELSAENLALKKGSWL